MSKFDERIARMLAEPLEGYTIKEFFKKIGNQTFDLKYDSGYSDFFSDAGNAELKEEDLVAEQNNISNLYLEYLKSHSIEMDKYEFLNRAKALGFAQLIAKNIHEIQDAIVGRQVSYFIKHYFRKNGVRCILIEYLSSGRRDLTSRRVSERAFDRVKDLEQSSEHIFKSRNNAWIMTGKNGSLFLKNAIGCGIVARFSLDF